MILLALVLASAVEGLKCTQCGGQGMRPCTGRNDMRVTCPRGKLSACYVGTDHSGRIIRDCLVLDTKNSDVRKHIENYGSDMTRLLNDEQVQGAFGFSWRSIVDNVGVINLSPGSPLNQKSSVCMRLCSTDGCNEGLKHPSGVLCQQEGVETNLNRRKRDLFLTYKSIGNSAQQLLERYFKDKWDFSMASIYPSRSGFSEEAKVDIRMGMRGASLRDSMLVDFLAHELNEEKHLDRIVITARTGDSAKFECSNPCTARCFHYIHSGMDREKQWDQIKKDHTYYFPWERNIGSRSDKSKRRFSQGPILVGYGPMDGIQSRHLFRQFKPYRFFHKRGNDQVRRHMARWWWWLPSTGNWSLDATDLVHYKDQPSKWPKDVLYQPDAASAKDNLLTTVYGPGIGPGASQKLAKDFAEKYKKFYSDTDISAILGCSPLTDKKTCRSMSSSMPIEIGWHAPHEMRLFHPGWWDTDDRGPLAGQALDFYAAPGSWVERLPGLSRAPSLIKAAKNLHNKEVIGEVLPGFGISGNVPFSSQGFHHNNFISMSGSWVGAGGNMPTNKFNLVNDAQQRFLNTYSNNAIRYAPVSYVSHQSSVMGSSASLDRRREFDFIAKCQTNIANAFFSDEPNESKTAKRDRQRCMFDIMPRGYFREDARYEGLDGTVTNCEVVNAETCKCTKMKSTTNDQINRNSHATTKLLLSVLFFCTLL